MGGVKRELLSDGTRVAVYEGNTHSDGVCYVFLHGWGSSADALTTLLPVESAWVAIDFPGHGASQRLSRAWTIHEFADVTRDILTRVAPNRELVIVGHSFGCRVGSLIATSEALHISKLIFISPLFFPDTRKRIAILRAVAHMVRTVLTRIGLGRVHKALLRLVGPYIGAGDYSALTTQWERDTFREVITYDLSEALAAITQPTEIIWGTADTVVVRERIEQAESILHCPVTYIDDASHFPFIENPDTIRTRLYAR